MLLLVTAVQPIVSPPTWPQVALAVIGVLLLITALLAWIVRMAERSKDPALAAAATAVSAFATAAAAAFAASASAFATAVVAAIVAAVAAAFAAVRDGAGRLMPRRKEPVAWNFDQAGIVFPAGTGSNDWAEGARFDSDDELSPVTHLIAGGIDGIAGRGERVVDAVRERPIEFLAGALAAGVAVGLVIPRFKSKSRIERMLEFLVEDRFEAKREANRAPARPSKAKARNAPSSESP